MLLEDKDRIFTNLYGLHDWRLEAAKKRGAWNRIAVTMIAPSFRHRVFFVLATLLTIIAAPSAAVAQAAQDDAARAPFNDFYGPMIGFWSVTFVEYDRAGEVVWSDTQMRRVRNVVVGEYYVIDTYPNSQWDFDKPMGMTFIGYNPEKSVVESHGFWPGSSLVPRSVYMGKFENGAVVTRTESVTSEGEPYRSRDVFEWVDKNTLKGTAMQIDANGEEWLHEVYEYRRVAADD